MNPIEPTREPFWDYTDFLLFVVLVFSSLAVSLVVGLAFTRLSLPLRLLLPQILWYVLAFGLLKALLLFRYQRPFWRSLGWQPISFGATSGALMMGPVLAISVGVLAFWLHTPEID